MEYIYFPNSLFAIFYMSFVSMYFISDEKPVAERLFSTQISRGTVRKYLDPFTLNIQISEHV